MLRHPPPALILAAVLVSIPVALGVSIVVFPFGHALVGEMDQDNHRNIMIALGAGLAIGVGVAIRLGARTGIPVGLLIGSLAGIITAIINVYVPGNGIAVILPPAMAMSIGMLDVFGEKRIEGNWPATRVSIGMALLLGVGMFPALTWITFVAAVIVCPVMAFMTGAVRASDSGWSISLHRPSIVLGVLGIASSVYLYVLVLDEGSRPPGIVAAALVIVFLWIVPLIFLQLGRWIAAWLRPRLDLYRQLARFVRILWVPIGGFAIGYGSIIVVFAGFYATLYHTDASAFSGVPEIPGADDWLFFSFFTALAQDYSTILPVSNAARLLSGCQIIVCIGWAVVVFAVVMTHVQPALAKIADGVDDA